MEVKVQVTPDNRFFTDYRMFRLRAGTDSAFFQEKNL